ncbi:MAG: hypothetical protein ACW96N_06640 [Candidatus Thorarchaeota archaeon]|jgi:hypothetical protein
MTAEEDDVRVNPFEDNPADGVAHLLADLFVTGLNPEYGIPLDVCEEDYGFLPAPGGRGESVEWDEETHSFIIYTDIGDFRMTVEEV